jgi:hypothetical protein
MNENAPISDKRIKHFTFSREITYFIYKQTSYKINSEELKIKDKLLNYICT